METEPGDWPAFYRGVATALREGSPPPVTAAAGVAVLEVIEDARGRPICQGIGITILRRLLLSIT